MENVLRCIFVKHQSQILLPFLHSNQGDVSSFSRNIFIFCAISQVTVVLRVISSGGVFSLGVSGKAKFLPAVQIISYFRNFSKIS